MHTKEILNYSSLVLFYTSLAFFLFEVVNAIIRVSDHFPFMAAILFAVGVFVAHFLSNMERECDELISKLELINSPSFMYQWLGLLSVSDIAQQLNHKLKTLGRLPTVGEIETLVNMEKNYCCLIRGMGEKPSPLGEDFSRLAV